MAREKEVLLWENVPSLGTRGDIVRVKAGYARNFLFPRRLASEPSPHEARRLQAHGKQAALREAQEHAELEALAQQLETASCTIEVRANEEGILFGSVGAKEISAALAVEGHTLDPEKIILEESIKSLGVYTVTARLHADIHTEFRVWVVEAKDE